MKRHIIHLFLLTVVTLLAPVWSSPARAASPKVPKLACEKFFTDKYKTDPRVSVTIINSPGNYFRSISVKNSSEIVAEMEKALLQDKKLANNTVEEYSGGHLYSMILNIPSGKYIINVGFDRSSSSKAELFISGTPEAFHSWIDDGDTSPQPEIEMPDGQGGGDSHIERMLGSLLGDLDATITAAVNHALRDSLDFVADDNGILVVAGDLESLQ